jgi:hypothetical protein
MMCLALLWGWPLEAAIFGMSWAVENWRSHIGAARADLILPDDFAPGIDYILLRIAEPKTRGIGTKQPE